MDENNSKEKTIDELDEKILSWLEKDSRMKGSDIAKNIDANERTVRDRIKRLIDNNIIKRFTIQIDFGFALRCLIRIKTKNIDRSTITQDEWLENKLNEKRHVHMIARCNDGLTLYILVLARTKEEIESLLYELNSNSSIDVFEVINLLDVVKLL